ncbi:MAG: carbohydrate ABC transporter permease [Erysipelotrichaceae bacterium]|nr:carbohydrate ABC transporter permease [Erysipelotrichaceae bacterium]MBR5755211.1 carbohydrate ABC transporter permease [Erysipelotrichaceae bacterium]
MAKNKNKIKLMKGETGFHYTALVIMILMMLFCVVPLILMLTVSLSSEASLVRGYRFIPEQWSLDAYFFMWAKRATILRAYGLTILITVVGTIISLIMTSMFAYPLSRKDFKPRNVVAFILFFTMLFNGGMVASYMVWTRLFHIKDSILAYLLPGSLMGGMNVLLVRNYFNANIPYSIIEAARLDGAHDWTIYSKIMVPLSKPIMITIGLFSALGYWNNWTAGIYYINNPKLYTIQVYLKKLMDSIQFLKTTDLSNEAVLLASRSLPTESARMAVAIIALIPILAVYPFIQKELIKGMVVGGVKG